MDIPCFFSEELDRQTTSAFLDEAGSRHAVQVLRMQAGDWLQLANGKGILAKAVISAANKRSTEVSIKDLDCKIREEKRIAIAISLVKTAARLEWFLEKVTEIGVTEIIPLLCTRTERQSLKYDRLKNILVSAMLQSQQAWMPELRQPVNVAQFIKTCNYGRKWIAHCENGEKQLLKSCAEDAIILIGPEGDFTPEEIQLAIGNDFIPVTLGHSRLRTETAGMVAAALMKLG